MNRTPVHILIVIALACCCVFLRCANKLTPQGGPRDSLPPIVRLTTPVDGKRNFTDKHIFIDFDEYIQLKDQSKEFFTSPPMKTPPALVNRGRTLRIDIKDTLRENQTYSFNFGTAIRDNNEGNPLVDFRYVFSTGPAIDSLIVTGYTADAMRGDSIGGVFAFFYDPALDTIPDYDSILYNYEPMTLGRSRGNGIFITQNLKDMYYKVYGLLDENSDRKYTPGVDKVGFLDSLINPVAMEPTTIWLDRYRGYSTADPQIYLRLFAETAPLRQNLSGSERPERHKAVLRFNAPFPCIDTLVFDSIPEDRVIREYMTADRDTMALWFNMPPEALPDTIRGRISYLKPDSLGNLGPTSQDLRFVWRKQETREEEREREREEKARQEAEEAGDEYMPPEKPNPFRFTVDAGAEVNPEKSIPIEFGLPLVRVDSTRIRLETVPDLGDPASVPFRIVRDTMNIRKWVISADWDEDSSYRLTVPEGTFENIAGERNDSLGAKFKIQPEADFATLTLNIIGKTPEANYIVQVVDVAGKPIKEVKYAKTGSLTFGYIPEGDVKIRITEDGNGNGQWDTGNLIERRQPERAEFYTGNTGDPVIPAKKNWEAEYDLDMARIFAPLSIEKLRSDLQKAEDARVTKYLEEQAKREAERQRQAEQGGGQQGIGAGGLGIGSAMTGAKQQVQSTF